MSLQRIRLELARDHEHPNGSSAHGYDFIAPIDTDGHLSLEEWRKARERCRVRRFAPGVPDEIGLLVHKRGGDQGGTWVFDYNSASQEDDEPGFKLDRHTFIPGGYISITEHDGVQRTFHIRAVVDVD
ncbi:MAG: hypothetical protein AB7L90_13415 [Hyphomicrobiaceae bacterium]